MGRRRRWLAIGGVIAAISVAGIDIATAHSCAEPVTIAQGQDTVVQVGVTVGDLPTTDITFEFPGIEVTDVIDRRGWEVEQDGNSVRFTGGRLEAQVCDLFEVSIRARDAGAYRVRALQRLDDGQVVEHPPNGDLFPTADGSSFIVVDHAGPPNPAFEQVIYVTEREESSGRTTALLIVTAGAVVAGLLVLTPRRGSGRRAAAGSKER